MAGATAARTVWSVAIGIALAALLPAPGGAVLPGEDQVPCTQPAMCPDIIVDEQALRPDIVTRSFSEGHCAVQEGVADPGTQRLLRFDTITANVGLGPLHIGSPSQNQQWFEWGECHGHWHFKDFATYRLWDPAAYEEWDEARTLHPLATADEVLAMYPHLQDGYVSGHKQAFCLMDLRGGYTPLVPLFASASPVYRSCGSNQGISVGWGDVYGRGLDGQWIQITGVPAGDYVLEVEANPSQLFTEITGTNNRSAVEVTI